MLLIETFRTAGIVLLTGTMAAYWLAPASRPARNSIAMAAVGLALLGIGSLLDTGDVFRSRAELLLGALTFGLLALARRRESGALTLLAAVFGAELLGVEIAYSHAAAEPGLLPVVVNALHWLAVATWTGAALHLAGARQAPAAEVLDRYARLALGALVVAGLSGGLLGFVHVHNADALAATAYGAGYRVKLGLAALLLVAVSASQLGAAALRRSSPNEHAAAVLRARRRIRIEALLLAALVLASGYLAARPPPGLAPFLNPQTWTVTADGLDLDVGLQPVSGRLGRARLDISAPGETLPDDTRVTVSMRMLNGAAGTGELEAVPVGPSEFLAEAVLAMPGAWQLDIALAGPGGAMRRGSRTLVLPAAPLTDDIRATLTHRTITFSGANEVTFAVGMLLLATGAWGFALGVRGRAPAWLVTSSLAGAAFGGLLALSVSFVKTYPTSFDPNPVPYTAATIRAGDALYREHCAECHGLTGRGDGPWAFEHRGQRLPDLTAPHMDTHTDGEIYWWNRYGIPSLEMPGYEGVLTDEQNWTVINFIRSLRHGVPPEA